MPSLKSKNKGRDARQSRSRNSTPGSVVNAPINGASTTNRLEIPLQPLMIPTNVLYEDILERHGSNGGIPDPRHLDTLGNDLRTLSQLAEAREDACSGTMRGISKPWKERVEEEREMGYTDKTSLKRSADDDDDDKSSKSKIKKRKEQKAKEERPLAHGAHGVARQDGVEDSPKGKPRTSPSKPGDDSGSSSSLSPPSQAQSPSVPKDKDEKSRQNSPAASSSSEEEHQPRPAASVPQFQTFGANPLEFDDPTVYHVREVTPNMTDDEKREIYNVAVFPHNDLHDLIAGTPPDKDFSNAKPSNQVNANTFAAYIEPYFRALTEEDMAFLKERGDRTTPFIMPRRGTKPYNQVWAEEDGGHDSHHKDKYPANQPRGSLDQMDDDVAETDKVSTGPVLARLLSLMRHEQRPEQDKSGGGALVNGDTAAPTNGAAEENNDAETVPSATNLPGSSDTGGAAAAAAAKTTSASAAASSKADYATMDERLRAELRYIGFVGADDEADYDAHADDDVAQRLRVLQAQLRAVMLVNGARRARLAAIAEEFMGHQEFATIREDLDAQVNGAFQKRTRSLLGKGKKQAKQRPGGAPPPTNATGLTRPGIGDVAKALMDRRRRWTETLAPIFSANVTTVRRRGDSVFLDADMAPFLAAEKDGMEEEAE